MSTKNSSIHTKKYRQILSAVHMVYRLVNSTYNVQELVLRLTRLLSQIIKTNSSSVYLIDPKSKKIVLNAIFDNKVNTLVSRKDMAAIKLSEKEKKVFEGYPIFEKHLIAFPLVADETVGAIFVSRKRREPAFNEFDMELLSVVVEQSVTAIKNLQLYEEQQKIILGSIRFIGKLLSRKGHITSTMHTTIYFKIIKNLGEKLNIGEDGIDNLYYASILHDTGAMDVPYEILAKTGQLTPEEFKVIRDHPAKSVEIIKHMEFLKPVLPIILYHHEKYDGTGYPSGLKKEQIPLGARILTVVQAFEAMRRDRPYKKKVSVQEAIAEIKRNSGIQFDPNVAEVFINLAKQKKFKNYLSSLER